MSKWQRLADALIAASKLEQEAGNTAESLALAIEAAKVLQIVRNLEQADPPQSLLGSREIDT